MLTLIWNTVCSSTFLSIPLIICIPLLPLSLLCLTKTNVSPNNNTSSILPIIGVGAGVYAIYKLNKVEKELKKLKETAKY